MQKIPPQQLHNTLTSLGFSKQAQGSATHWTLSSGEKNRLVLFERNANLQVFSQCFTQSEEGLIKALRENLIRLWGTNIRIWQQVSEEGILKVIVEESPSIAPSKRGEHRWTPPSAIGWTVRLAANDSHLTLYLDDFFAIGQAPKNWLADCIHASLKSTFSSASRFAKCVSLYEFTLDLWTLQACNYLSKPKVEVFQTLKPNFQSSLVSLDCLWSTQDRTWYIGTKPQDVDNAVEMSKTASRNALASRSLPVETQNFDQALVERKQLGMAAEFKRTDPERIAMQYLCGAPDAQVTAALDALISEIGPLTENHNTSGIVLTAALSYLSQQKRPEDAINTLALLNRTISVTFAPTHTIPTLQLAVPEFAGDQLAQYDFESAVKAYRNAVSTKNHPRIYQKLATVFANLNDIESEKETLEEWLRVERRIFMRSHALLRLAEIAILHDDATQALDIIERSIEARMTPEPLWIEIIEAASQRGEPHQALDLLSRIERSLKAKTKASQERLLIKAYLCMASIWQNILQRPDLAAVHYNTILQNADLCSTEELAEAETALEGEGQAGKAVFSRHERWKKMTPAERQKNKELGAKLFESFAASESLELQFETAVDMLQIGQSPEKLQTYISSWAGLDKTLDWRAFINACREFYKHGKHEPGLPEIAAKIARDRFGDHDLAIEMLTKPGIPPRLSEADFNYLIDRLSYLKRPADIRSLLLDRLDSLDETQKTTALQLAVQYGVVGDEGVVHTSLCVDWELRHDETLILKRYGGLTKQKQIQDAVQLSNSILSLLSDKPGVQGLVRSIWDFMNSSPGPERADICQVLIEFLATEDPGDTETLSRSISFFQECGRLEASHKLLQLVLEQGYLPKISLAEIELQFKDDSDLLAKIYILSLEAATAPEKPSLARKALEQLKLSGLWSKDMEQCFAVLVSADLIKDSDLPDLRKLHENSENKKVLIGALISLARGSKKQDERKAYFQEAAQETERNLKDPALYYEIICEAYAGSVEPKDLLHMARAARQAGKTEHATHLCLTIIQTPNCLLLGSIVTECLTLLASNKETRLLATTSVQTLISWAEASGDTATANQLIDFSIAHGLATKSLIHHEIIRRLTHDDLTGAVQCLVKLIQKSDTQKDFLAPHLDQIYAELEKNDLQSLWWQLMGSISNHESIREFSSASRHEVVLRYAMWLGELEHHKGEAMKLLYERSEEVPSDSRIWIPLYILLDDAKDGEKLAKHLERIIPKIENDPKLLEKYPINVETLKLSLRRAKFSPKLHGEPVPAKKASISYANHSHSSAAVALAPEISPPLTHQEVAEQPAFGVIHLGELSIQEVLTGSSHQAAPGEDYDWHRMALLCDAPEAALKAIKEKEFASELEKHIALQVAALLTGSVKDLSDWQWPIWKDARDVGYELSSKGRMPAPTDLQHLQGPAAKLLLSLAPVFAELCKERLTVDKIVRRSHPQAKMQTAQLSVDDEVITRTSLRHYTDKLTKRHFAFIDTPDLEQEIYADPSTRYIHFSKKHYENRPISHLFHPVRFQTFSITNNISAILNANPAAEILPVVDYLRRLQQSSALDKIRATFGAKSSYDARIANIFTRYKVEKFKELAGKLKDFNLDHIQKIQHELKTQAFRVQLAGTLDLIGLFEALTGTRADDLDKNTIKKYLEKSQMLRDLLMYTTKLRF